MISDMSPGLNGRVISSLKYYFTFQQSGVYYSYGHWLDFISVAPTLNPLTRLMIAHWLLLASWVFNPVMFYLVDLFLIN